MAGNDDRNRVPAVRRTDGAHRFRPPDAFGNLAVRRRLAVGNALQLFEHAHLELGPGQLQRQVEGLALAGEVLSQLVSRCDEWRFVVDPVRFRRAAHRTLREPDNTQAGFVSGQQQLAHRRIDITIFHRSILRSPPGSPTTRVPHTRATAAMTPPVRPGRCRDRAP